MGGSYMIKVQAKHKKWIATESVKNNMPIYQIFEQVLYPYYQANFKEPCIKKISLSEKTSLLSLSYDFRETLKLEAIDKETNIISLVNAVFEFYLSCHS